jgi:hypothetical protein
MGQSSRTSLGASGRGSRGWGLTVDARIWTEAIWILFTQKGKSGKSASSWGLSEGEVDREQGVCSLPPRSERVGMWRGGLLSGARHDSTGEKALVRLDMKLREGRMGGRSGGRHEVRGEL